MALETTAENLNELVKAIIKSKDGKDVPTLLSKFDAANNTDNNQPQEKLFYDGEKSVNQFREELLGKKADQTTTQFWGLVQSVTGLSGATKPSPLEIKKKVGFEKDEPNPWLKKVDSTKLTKEKAQKFFYQRLLLSYFEDEKIFVPGAVFNDELHPTFEAGFFSEIDNSYEKDSVQDLWLYAKFNELKEEKEIPEDYEYKSFVGLVRKSIESAAKKTPPEKVTTKTIVDDLISDHLEKLKQDNLVPKYYNKSLFSSAVKNAKEEELKADKNFTFNQIAFDKIVGDIKNREPKDREKAGLVIQRIYRGHRVRQKVSENKKSDPVNENSPVASRDQVNKLIETMKEILEQARIGNASSLDKMNDIQNQIKDILKEAKEANLAQTTWQKDSLQQMAEMMEQVKKLAEAKPGKKDDAKSEWQTSDENGKTKNVTYKYLVDNHYVSNGDNHFLIPEIRGRGDKSITQYENGLTVFNYKDLNEFSQDADIAGKGWDKKDNRLLSSIVCIGEGENQRHCVVTSSARGVTKNFISHAEFREIIEGGNKFFDQGLEAAIKTSALDETLEVLNSAKERYKNEAWVDSNKIKIIDNEIAAIEVRKDIVNKLQTKYYDNFTVDDRLIFLNLYNNLDIALPKGIDFNDGEKKKFDAAKSRTVVIDDSFNQALEVVLKMDAAKEIIFHLEEEKNAIIEKENESLKKKLKEIRELKEISSAEPECEEQEESIKARSELNIALQTQKLDNAIECLKINDNATFEDKKKWSPKPKLNTYLDDLPNLSEGNKIKELADSLTKKNEDPQDIAKKLTSATSNQINTAQDLAEKEFGMKKKADSRKEKLENATDKEKESARYSASCNNSHKMANSVEKSIKNEMINGLDSSEVNSIAEDMAKAHAKKGYIYGGEDKEAYKRDVSKLLKAPVPHSHVNGVGFHRPRGTNIVSVAFNYSGVGDDADLPGNTEAYPYIDGSFHCYIGCRVCKKDGMMTVWEDGKAVPKEYKRGDTVIDQNTISFLDPKTQIYTHVEASPSALKAHLELMKEKGNPYPGSVETIMAQYQKMQIKVTSQVNNANREEEPDIERKVSIMHKGKTLSYNADKPETTIGKKKVVTKAIGFNEKEEVINLRPGFQVNVDSKVQDEQEQFVEMNKILLPDGGSISLYVKLSTNDGEVIHEPEPFIISGSAGNEKFQELTPDIIETLIKSRAGASNMNGDDLKNEAKKLFGRAENECKNTKLIVPLGEKGEEHISIPLDFTGVGSGIEKPSNSFFARGATKLDDVNPKLPRNRENIRPSIVR